MLVANLPTTANMLIIFCLASIVSVSCLDSRIIGGEPTTIEKYPYQVSIHYMYEFQCGGSIIKEDWILTAAHCVYGLESNYFAIRVASTFYDRDGILLSDNSISKIISHELYDKNTLDYDVAVIKLSEELILGPKVTRIVLIPNSLDVQPNAEVHVTGWGLTSPDGENSKILQVLKTFTTDQNYCQMRYRLLGKNVTDNMLCAGGQVIGKDTCVGDSGGALVWNDIQIGIVSWGVTNCASGYPGVYTRVAAIRNWIYQKTGV